MKLATVITALSMISAVGVAIYFDIKTKREKEGIKYQEIYTYKTAKDWNSEEISTAKRLWMERVRKFEQK